MTTSSSKPTIGVASGDPYVIHKGRKLTRPDSIIQGLLVRQLLTDGYQVRLLTPTAVADKKWAFALQESTDGQFQYASELSESLAMLDECQIFWADRLHKTKKWTGMVKGLTDLFKGPKIYHQFIYYARWTHPVDETWHVITREHPDDHGRRPMSNTACPIVPINQFHTWEPFLQKLIFQQSIRGIINPDPRYNVGYIGRMPKSDPRSQVVIQYLMRFVAEGYSVAIGGTGDAYDLARTHEIAYLGTVTQDNLMEQLDRLDLVLQFAASPYLHAQAIPNRIVEAAIAGVPQLLHSEMALERIVPYMEHFKFASWSELKKMLPMVQMKRPEIAVRQKQALEDHIEPDRVMALLEKTIQEIMA